VGTDSSTHDLSQMSADSLTAARWTRCRQPHQGRKPSRPQVLATVLGAVLLLSLEVVSPPRATSAPLGAGGPQPIPSTIPGEAIDPSLHHNFHIAPPMPAPAGFFEPISITDFQGVAGVAHVTGTGTGIDTTTGTTTRLNFDADMRVMRGFFVGKDGSLHAGAFGFI